MPSPKTGTGRKGLSAGPQCCHSVLVRGRQRELTPGRPRDHGGGDRAARECQLLPKPAPPPEPLGRGANLQFCYSGTGTGTAPWSRLLGAASPEPSLTDYLERDGSGLQLLELFCLPGEHQWVPAWAAQPQGRGGLRALGPGSGTPLPPARAGQPPPSICFLPPTSPGPSAQACPWRRPLTPQARNPRGQHRRAVAICRWNGQTGVRDDGRLWAPGLAGEPGLCGHHRKGMTG